MDIIPPPTIPFEQAKRSPIFKENDIKNWFIS